MAKHIHGQLIVHAEGCMKKENRENNEFTIVSALNQIELFSTQLASTTELEEVYTLTTSLTREILHLDYSTLLLLEDKEEQKLLLKATDGFSQEMVNTFVLHEGQGLPSLALENGQVETVVDFHLEDRFEVTSLMGELDIRSAIAAPMMIANRIFGVLIGHSLQKRKFSTEEQQIYQVLANHAAIAIANASLIDSLYMSEQTRIRKIEELEQEKEKNVALTNEFESIFSTIVSGVILMRKGRYLARCNDKLAEIFGYESAQSMHGMSTLELHLSEEKYREFGRKYYAKLTVGQVVQTEYTLKRKDGSPILCRLSGRAVDQSEPPDLDKGFVWLVDDITRSNTLEKEILQARKLESIGIMAGGIGHDFNNILSAIMGNLSLAKRFLEQDHPLQEMLDSAEEAANRAKDLTAKLLLFTRREGRSVGKIWLQELFAEYKFEQMLGEKTTLQLDFQDGLAAVKIMPDHLKAIIQNLLVNADSSTEGGGRIIVSGENIEIPDDEVPGLSGGNYIKIEVADNGSGIDTDILENIFDPYFTTKTRSSSWGSGLGLAIVHSIVKKNHGSISVRSDKQEGTVFTLLLPAAGERFDKVAS